MRRYQCFSCLLLFCLIAAMLPACNSQPPVFTVDSTHIYPFEGWGTSLAWWAEVVGQWPDASQRAALEDALFNSNTGLGLNVVRYNFGASTPNNQCAPNSFRIGGSVPSDLPPNQTDEQSVNLSNDNTQLQVLRDANDLIGPTGKPIFEAFANSAPDWMLKNNCTQGNGKANNLLPGHEQDYANYLAALVQAFSKTGITFRTIEPFNEPDGEWKTKSKDDHGGQEGMYVDLFQQERIIQYLHTALQQNGAARSTSISAADYYNIDKAVDDYKKYDSATRSDLSQFNVHGYNGNQRNELYQFGQQSGKRIWMSEDTTNGTTGLGPLCIQSKQGTTPLNLFSALDLSCRITRDLTVLHSQVWIYWQAVESSDDPSQSGCHSNTNVYGLLQTPFCQGTQKFKKTKQYYAMAQYSKFLRPGYQIINSSDPNAVVAYDPASHNLVIVETNDSPNTPRTVSYDLSNFSNTYRSAMPYITSTSENVQQQSSLSISNKQFTSTVPPNSITTYVITNASISPSPTTVPMPPTQTSCPTAGTARAAVMRPLAPGNDQNIAYIESTKNASNGPAPATLYRYDMKTDKTTQILHIENTTPLGPHAEVSGDGQWVVFDSEVSGLPAIQMIRMDGQGLQTLYCLPPTQYSYEEIILNILLSPDQKQLAFVTGSNQATFSLLNMTNGTVQTELQPTPGGFTFYQPAMWLDNTHLYLWRYPIMQSALFLLNTQNGPNQPDSALVNIADSLNLGVFDISPDRTKLFTGVCQVCGQGIFIGPSTISVQPATGTARQVLYTTTGAINGLVAVSNSTLLFSVSSYSQSPDRPADTSQDGTWKIHVDGSGLTRLSNKTAGLAIDNHQDISPDGKWYLISSGSGLFFASLDGGGAPVQFTPATNATDISFAAIGWTMI